MIKGIVITAVAAYLLGSFSTAVIVSRMKGRDIRREGSGNAGATNMARTFGLILGLVTLLCDMLKAVLAMYIGHRLAGDWGIAAGGVFVLLGHCFTLYHSMRGGKGVSVGVVIGYEVGLYPFICAFIAFWIAALISKRVSVGSVTAAIVLAVSAFIFKVTPPFLVMGVVSVAIVVFQHRANIKRLIRGEEPVFRLPKIRKKKK